MPKSLIIPYNVEHNDDDNNNNNNNHFIEVSVNLAEHSCSTNQGDYKSTKHTTNPMKFVVCIVRLENWSTREKTSQSRVENRQS